MRVNILNFVFFSIIICSFEYAQNELYFINKRNIYLERNIINFINNRTLADADNQFDLYDFYGSNLSLANQFSDCDEEMIRLRNIIDSHIRKNKENNTLPNLNNVDKKTKKLIYELQKELEETKKEIDNIRNNELVIQPIKDKRRIKKDENIPVSDHEVFKQLEISENALEIGNYNFEDEYNEIISSDIYKEIKMDEKLRRGKASSSKKLTMVIVGYLAILSSGVWYSIIFFIPYILSAIRKCWKVLKLKLKISKIQKSST